MEEGCGGRFCDVWDQRWKGSEESERLTLLGKTMFRAKKKALKILIPSLPVKTVLEAGCGLGHTMSVYRDLGLDCTGIDISPCAVATCLNKGLKVEIGTIEDVMDSYDLISSDGMLEHYLHFEPYAIQLMRISNRFILLIQPNHDSFFGKTLAYLSEIFMGHKNVHEYNYRVQDFISVFRQNGFDIIKNFPVFFDVFRLLLFEKRFLSSDSPLSVPSRSSLIL